MACRLDRRSIVRWRALLATASYQSVYISRLSDGLVVTNLEGHNLSGSLVVALAFSPTGEFLASGDTRGKVNLWRVSDWSLVRAFIPSSGLGFNVSTAVAFSPDGQFIAINFPTTTLYRVSDGTEVQTVPAGANQKGLAFSPDGKLLAGNGSYLTLVAIASNGVLFNYPHDSAALGGGVAFNRAGDKVFFGDIGLEAYRVSDGALARTLTNDLGNFRTFDAANGLVAGAGVQAGEAYVWTEDGQLVQNLTSHGSSVRSVAYSPNGQWLASASADWSVNLWDAQTGQFLRKLNLHSNAVNTLTMSSNLVVSGSADRTVKIWDSASGALLQSLSGHLAAVNSVAVSRDGELIASSGGADKTVKLWSAVHGTLQSTFIHSKQCLAVAFSPDGQLLAATDGNDIPLRRMSDYSVQLTLRGHTGPVRSVAFSPDGQFLVSCGFNANFISSSLLLWRVSDGALQSAVSGRGSHAPVGLFRSGLADSQRNRPRRRCRRGRQPRTLHHLWRSGGSHQGHHQRGGGSRCFREAGQRAH